MVEADNAPNSFRITELAIDFSHKFDGDAAAERLCEVWE